MGWTTSRCATRSCPNPPRFCGTPLRPSGRTSIVTSAGSPGVTADPKDQLTSHSTMCWRGLESIWPLHPAHHDHGHVVVARRRGAVIAMSKDYRFIDPYGHTPEAD